MDTFSFIFGIFISGLVLVVGLLVNYQKQINELKNSVAILINDVNDTINNIDHVVSEFRSSNADTHRILNNRIDQVEQGFNNSTSDIYRSLDAIDKDIETTETNLIRIFDSRFDKLDNKIKAQITMPAQ
jgi:ABC-type transporter Mla subunit MlaD